MGSLAADPRPGSCPYCGRKIGARFARSLPHRGSSPVRKLFTLRHPPEPGSRPDPPPGSTLGQFGEDIRYLAGIVGWPAAIWKVTRTAVLNTLVVLTCLLVLALPPFPPATKAVVGVILAIQLGRFLIFLRQARRDTSRNRLAHRLASATQHGSPPEVVLSRPPTGPPRAINLVQTSAGEQPARPDQ